MNDPIEFTVTQTRTVVIRAEDMADAIDLARFVFRGSRVPANVSDWAEVVKKVKITSLEIEEN